jgi:hypothetical protein
MIMKYTNEQIKQVCDLYISGQTGKQISQSTSIPLATVYFLMAQNGLTRRPPSDSKQKANLEELKTLYAQGMSTKQIAKQLGIRSSSVYQRMVRNSIPLRTKSEAANRIIPIEDEPKLVQDYLNNALIRDLAKKWGASKDTIFAILRKHNVKIRMDKAGRIEGSSVYDDDQHGLAVEMYNDGLSPKSIGEKLNIPESSVDSMLKRKGVIKRKAEDVQQKASIETIKKLYEGGLSVKQVAKELGYTSSGSVSLRLRNAGVVLRKIPKPAYRIPKIHWPTVVDRYCKGEGSTEIAETYSVSYATILKILHDMNVPIRLRHYRHKVGGYTGKRDRLTYRVRNCKKYIDWRIAVLKRNGYTCQDCDQIGKDLEAHHLKPFYQIFNDFAELLEGCDNTPDIITERAQHYLPFWDINNGLTLCKECHIKRTKEMEFFV